MVVAWELSASHRFDLEIVVLHSEVGLARRQIKFKFKFGDRKNIFCPCHIHIYFSNRAYSYSMYIASILFLTI
jgi:hypothetical protein